jgi:CheY-like chemotaxis protein
VAAALADFGCIVLEAAHLNGAAAVLEGRTPDLALVDAAAPAATATPW